MAVIWLLKNSCCTVCEMKMQYSGIRPLKGFWDANNCWQNFMSPSFPHWDVLVLEKRFLCVLSDEGWSLIKRPILSERLSCLCWMPQLRRAATSVITPSLPCPSPGWDLSTIEGYSFILNTMIHFRLLFIWMHFASLQYLAWLKVYSSGKGCLCTWFVQFTASSLHHHLSPNYTTVLMRTLSISPTRSLSEYTPFNSVCKHWCLTHAHLQVSSLSVFVLYGVFLREKLDVTFPLYISFSLLSEIWTQNCVNKTI